MANSIVIEIVANFKDNATAPAQALNAELDKLEKRKVNVGVTSDDKASRIIDDMNSKLDKVDGSKAAQAFDGVNAKAEQFANGVTEKTVSVDTSNAEHAIDSLQRKIDGIGEKSIKVTPSKESIWVNGKENIRTYSDTIASSAEEILEDIPRIRRRANVGGANYGYDQSAIDFIEKYANSHAGLSNNAEIPANFWTELATAEDKNLYKNGQMSALALAQFGAVNPDALSAADRAEYDRLTGATKLVDSITEETPRVTKVSSKYYGYDQSAIDFIENYGSEGVDDVGGFWGRISPEIDKNRTVRRIARMGRMFGSTSDSVKIQALSGAGAMAGAAIAGSALVGAGGDIMDSFNSNNRNDSERSLVRGITKGTMTAIGGIIGTLIAPGVGTMIGAGLGGGASNLFGDNLADSISGIHKSAEELKQDRLDEIFGDIAMSAEDLTKVFQNMVGTATVQMRAAHSQALTTGFSLQDQTASSYYGVVESGSKLDIKGNLGFHIPDDEFKAYEQQVSDYMDSIEETMNQEMYNAFMVNDDLFGYGQWDTEGLSDKYKSAFEAFYKQKKELSEYLERALSDGNFSADEREHVFGIIHGMQQTTTELSPDEGQVKQNSYEFLAKNGLLSQGSYSDLIGNMQSDYNNRIYELSTTRSKSIENGMSADEANKTFWSEMNTSTESYLQSILDSAHNVYNADYSTALSSAWDGKTDIWGTNKNGLNQIYEEGSSYQKTLSEAIRFDNGYHTDKNGYASSYRTDSLNRIQSAGEILMDSFDNIDAKAQGALGEAYTSMQPMLQQIESQAKTASLQGRDTSAYMDEMMSMYQIGALGGDASAQEKYTAMLMASDKTSSDAINAIFGNDYEMMAGRMGKDFADMWQLINGSGSSGAEAIQKQAEEEQKALDEAAEKTAQAAQDGSEKKKDAIDESGDKVEEATKDNTEKITNATEESKDQITEATENSEADENLAENIIQTINDSLENLDDDTFKDIKLGETLMNSISESLSTDNMDFKGLGFGENLMNTISESLSTDNMDFKTLGFGESLMSAIQESLSVDNIDYSQINIGESIMNGISASLENIDVGTIDIATKVTESINSSLQASDMQIITNLSLTPGNIDTASIMSAVTAALAEVSNNSVAVSAVISGTANYTLGVYPTMVPDVGGIANYDLGTAPTEAPDISGISYYSGVFPTSAPTVYGSAVYTSIFSGSMPSVSAEENATGGFVSGRQLSWVGEEGPEAIIPLVPGRRARGLELWMQAGRALGVMENANGGIVGGEPSYGNNPLLSDNEDTSNENTAVTIAGTSSTGSVSVDVGGITVSIHIDGKSKGNIIEEIKAHSTEIAEVITDELERHMAATFANS